MKSLEVQGSLCHPLSHYSADLHTYKSVLYIILPFTISFRYQYKIIYAGLLCTIYAGLYEVTWNEEVACFSAYNAHH